MSDDELTDDLEEIDEGRTTKDKAPFWGWLAAVGLVVVGGTVAAVYAGYLQPGPFVVTGQVDVSGPLSLLVRGLVYIFLAVTAIAALVVAPGEYLAAIHRFLKNYGGE